jgi:molecular chaperone IbpA
MTELMLFPKNIEQLLIGLDSFTSDLSNAGHHRGASSTFPPFNIIQEDADHYSIKLALAGFSPEDISISTENGFLTIKSDRENNTKEDTRNYVYKGIADRDFSRSFRLYEYVNVTDAEFFNGILTIKLERKIPEHLKPQTIKITSK